MSKTVDTPRIHQKGAGVPTILYGGLIAITAISVATQLVPLVRASAELRRADRIDSRGERTTGRVISSNPEERRHGSGSRSHSHSHSHTVMVETIEFTTFHGGTIRGNPLGDDVGMLDRTGMDLSVMFARDEPSRFLVAAHGEELSTTGLRRQVFGALGGLAVTFVTSALFLLILFWWRTAGM